MLRYQEDDASALEAIANRGKPLILIAVIALCLQSLAPYVVWRSRWNIPTHLAAGFCVTAYIIPGLLTNVWDDFSNDTVFMFTAINVLGTLVLYVAIFIPTVLDRSDGKNPFLRFVGADPNSSILSSRVITIFSICVVGIYVSYAVMGFVPLLASDPLMARQFRGIYRDPYYRVAYLYRFSFSVLADTMSLVLLLAWLKRSKALLLLTFLSFLALLLSLSRGSMASGLLLFLGVIAAKQRAGMKWYLPLVILVFPLGSIFFYLFGQLTNTSLMGNSTSLIDNIASGAPDISDQLLWLQGFMSGNFFSYGRTIYGGLIPGNYEWNPGVWTVSYTDVGADITDLGTGGLRLTTAEWGYANFGWFGVFLMPFISGFLNGAILVKLRKAEKVLSLPQMLTIILLYNTLGNQIALFFLLSIHNIPAILFSLYLWNSNNKKDKFGFTGTRYTA